jgi:hypothetical protein
MIQVFSKEEMIKMEEKRVIKTNEWWETLSSKDRNYLYDRYYDFFKQSKCLHKNLTKLLYYNNFVYYCKNCGVNFTEAEIRDEKINEILKGDN